ncbi:MAG: hypothetical protein E7361_01105 [Clostridiales bacterium]|nr:hypothetical protein [Clostridiales bacterium]
MSSKQKIAISAIGIVLVLAVIGLTIGLVLVAGSASVANTMKVTYKAENVACTITASADNGIKVNGEDSDSVQIEATDDAATATSGAFAFADFEFTDANLTITYTFNVKNDASATGSSIDAVLEEKDTTVITNMTVVYTSEAVTIAPGANKDLTIVVSIDAEKNDPTIAASLVGAYTLKVTQTPSN